MRFVKTIVLLASSHLAALPGRSLCLIASVALALASIVLMQALVSPDLPTDAATGSVFVQNARSGAMLPIRYSETIESMPLVEHVVHIGALAFFCKPGVPVSVNAYGGAGVEWLLSDEYGVKRHDYALWSEHMSGLLVGSRLAQQCGWAKGMRMRPESAIGGMPVEIRISGIIPDRAHDPYLSNIAIGHYEYANRLFGPAQHNKVGGIVAYAADARKIALLAAQIDARFATSDPPTYSRVSSEAQNVLRKFGQVQTILLWIALALLGCTLLVVASVMAYAAAQRRRLFGLLMTLGFSRVHAASAFALEYLILLAVGAGLGVLAAWLLIGFLSPRISMIVGSFSLPSTTASLAASVTLAILACSMAAPLATVWKARPTDASRF